MKTYRHLTMLLPIVICFSGCSVPNTPAPKTRQETEAEAREGKVPDNVRDPRPEMPGMGPLSMPMR